MDTAAKATSNALPESTASTTSEKPLPPAAMPTRWLRRLWERMAVMYPVLWAQRCGDSPQHDAGELTIAGEVWREVLMGLAGEQVQLGLQRCVLRTSEFPPSPQEFRALAMGVPTWGEVRLAMRDQATTRTPFIVLLHQHLDHHNWRTSDQRTSDRMLRDAYDTARDHVMLGGELPPPMKVLESPDVRSINVAPPERAEQARREIYGRAAAAGPDA